jgi:hypothetical protein
MSNTNNTETNINWPYLGRAAVFVLVGLAVGAGGSYGADATGTLPYGLAALIVTALGGIGLLAFLSATTAEPNQSASLAVDEPAQRESDNITPLDRGFQVSGILLWASLGVAGGGLVSLILVFG